MSFWTKLRDTVESAASVAGNYFLPGSGIVTSHLVSKGSQDQLNSDLGRVAMLASGVGGADAGNLSRYSNISDSLQNAFNNATAGVEGTAATAPTAPAAMGTDVGNAAVPGTPSYVPSQTPLQVTPYTAPSVEASGIAAANPEAANTGVWSKPDYSAYAGYAPADAAASANPTTAGTGVWSKPDYSAYSGYAPADTTSSNPWEGYKAPDSGPFSAPGANEPGYLDKAKAYWNTLSPLQKSLATYAGASLASKALGGGAKGPSGAAYNGPLTKYSLSPDFKPSQVTPSQFWYTPKGAGYASGGITDYDKQFGEYMKMMEGEQRKEAPSIMSVGTFHDDNPTLRNLPANEAGLAIAEMAQNRAHVNLPGIKRFARLGSLHMPGDQAKKQQSGDVQEAAAGGIMQASSHLGGYAAGGMPRLLNGPGDGMSDDIPATINNKQPARLADGEFVVPADVVSHLGNGSTKAGSKKLHDMMSEVRKARTGNPKQGKRINPDKYLPA